MANKKLTDVDEVTLASDTDSVVLIKNKTVRQIKVSKLIPQDSGGGGTQNGATEQQMNTAISDAIKQNVTNKNFLQSSVAESTYLKKTDASSNYPSKIDIPFKFKMMTKDEYDRENKDSNTVYFIVG
ncbi:hypothetical protein HMPREF1215_00638 [Coprococcus sp. HPP0074]|nr:hypothetical protein HMPREF1215_00638 [Coprococcus sp. HPP0074]